MTSTVLDVTVMLLCVSASVVALVAVDDGTSTAAPDAESAADRLATETATVGVGETVESLTSPKVVIGDTEGTIHATLAELLVMVAEIDEGDDARAKGSADERMQAIEEFRTTVIETVSERLGPRVRIDVHAATDDGSITDTVDVAVGDTPPRSTDVNTAVVSAPGPRTDGGRVNGWRVIVRTW
ncbi:DUF7284 family protein [Halorubrum vacuolatum]|uniref:Uncharacterized protein n=1 Tax=Halorubrum vacuolatum TaxID=63740 RepID=A0A238X3C3_HALVU|nr:hypothetical protein [Halorubrum vacuolatum]SNR53476.1 hypothetical protein SAMN06264855_11330 [Halorubrum vacuolatum]